MCRLVHEVGGGCPSEADVAAGAPHYTQGAAATDGLTCSTWKDIGFWWGRCQKKRGERSRNRNRNIDYRHHMVLPVSHSRPVFLAIRAAQPGRNKRTAPSRMFSGLAGTHRPRAEASIICLSRPGVVRCRLRPLVGQLWGINDGTTRERLATGCCWRRRARELSAAAGKPSISTPISCILRCWARGGGFHQRTLKPGFFLHAREGQSEW